MASNGGRINFQVGFNVDKSGLNSLKSSLQSLQKMKITDFSGTNEELRQIKNTAKQVQQALQKAFNANLGSLNVNKFNQELQKSKLNVNQIYSQFSKAGAQGQAAFSKMAQSVLTTNLQLRQTNSLVSKMGTTLMNTIKWNISSSIVQNFTNSIRQAFQYVQALDASLTDIRIVTGDSTDQMREFARQANNAAQALGRSTMDYTKAALTFYQQGLDDQSVAARTQATLQAQNITGAGQEMADYLTAVWNGYRVANEQAQLYVDRLAAVADSSASNMAQLATAMSKVAATANAMGVDVDQLNAQIATIIATTRQAPQTVGNALKTIFARINDIQAGTQDAEVSLGHYTGTMAELGINVLDASGHLRDTGQVMEEIGEKWATMSREQQIYLARTMAGQRQYNNLIALFDNWGRYTELVNVSMDSQGTLMEKNSRYMDSLGAKMEQLGAAGEKVKDALIDEQDMKGLITAATRIVSTFGSFIQSIGGARGALLAFGSIALQVFSGTISKEINAQITNFQNYKHNLNQIAIAQDKLRTQGANWSKGQAAQYVTNLQSMQNYWSVLSNEEKEAQQNRANQIASLRSQRDEYKESTEVAENFYNKLTGKDLGNASEGTIERITSTIQNRVEALKQSLQDIHETTVLNQGTGFGISDEQKEQNLRALEELDGKTKQLMQSLGAYGETEGKEILNLINNMRSSALGKQGLIDENELTNVIDKLDTLSNKVQSQTGKVINYKANIEGVDKAEEQLNKLQNTFDRVNQQARQLFNVQSTVQFISTIGRTVTAVMSLSNVFKILKNDSLSAGQKIRQVITNLAMTIPMLLTSMIALNNKRKEILVGLAAQTALTNALTEAKKRRLIAQSATLDTLSAEQKATIAKILAENGDLTLTNLLTVAKTKLAIAIGNVVAAMHAFTATPVGAAIAAITVVIGAAVAAGVALYKVWNSSSQAAKNAAQSAANAKAHYNQLKEAYEDLKHSLQDYEQAQNALDQLTQGTQEWKQALLEANNAVLQLLQNYPKLAQYVSNQNGRLTISQEGQQAILEQQARIVRNAQAESLLAAARSRTASSRATAADIGHNTTTFSDFINQIGRYEGNSNEVLAIAEALNNIPDFNAGDLQNGLVDLADQISELTGISLTDVTTYLRENGQRILALSRELNNNTSSLQTTAEILAGLALDDNITYQNLSQTGQRLAQILGARLIEVETEISSAETFLTGFMVQQSQFASSPYMQRLLQQYNRAQGTDYRYASNAVTGNILTGNLQIHLEGVEGGLSIEDFLSSTRIGQSLNQIENSTLQTITHIENDIRNSNISTEAQNAIVDWIDDKGLSNLTPSDLIDISEGRLQINQILDDDSIQALATFWGIEIDQVQQRFQAAADASIATLNQIPEGLVDRVRSAYQSIKFGDATASQRQQIANSLAQAFRTGGSEALDSLTQFYNGIDDFDVLDELNSQFNFMYGTTDELQQALYDAGIQTKFTDQQLQAYINHMKQLGEVLNPEENYANLHQIIDNLAFNDTISDEDDINAIRNVLQEHGLNLEDYFDLQLDGSYQLRASAQQFYDLINGFSLEPFEQRIHTIQEELGQLGSWEGREYSSSVLGAQNFNEFSTNAMDKQGQINAKLAQAQVDFLSAIESSLNEQQQDVISIIQDFLANGGSITDLSAQQYQQLSEIISQHRGQWEDIPGTIEQARRQLEIYQDQLANGTNFIDADVNTEQLDELATYLENYADQLDDVDDAVQDNRQVALDLAQSMLRYNHALEETVNNYDDWLAMLQSNDIQAHAQAVSQLRNTYSDLLDLPFEAELSDAFLSNVDNLNLLRQAANGSEEAYNRLRVLAAQDLLITVGVDPSRFESDVDWMEQAILAFTGQDFDDIQVGAELNDQAFLQGLTDMVNAAGMTAQQATDYLSAMGIDAEVTTADNWTEGTQEYQDIVPSVKYIPVKSSFLGNTYKDQIASISYGGGGSKRSSKTKHNTPATAVRVTSAHKSSGGNFKFNHANRPSGGGSGGGGGGRGGSSKASQPSIQAPSQDQRDPYHDINRLLDKQSQKLKKLQDQDKKLVNRDRLNNINAQNEALEEQANLLENKLAIAESEQIRLRNQLLADTNGYAQFGRDGELTNFNQMLANAQQQYNNYIAYYNTLTKEQQDAEKDRLELQKERYERVKDTAKEYEETLDLQRDLLEQINEAQEKQYENLIKASKIKVDLSIDAGDAERDWLDFENKVIKKLDKDDFLGNAKANIKELMSYFDSDQVQNTAKQIQSIRNQIAIMERGGTSSIYGNNLAQAKEDLEQYMKQQMDDLEKVQSLVDKIKEKYLDGIKQAKKQMDDQIDQYERINDLIEHNVKLTQMLYGDKAYDTMNKYYELQERNNKAELDSLKKQQDFWQQKMNNEVVGSDAWNEFKKNLDNVTDDLNKKLEDMIDNLSDKWQNRVDGIIDKLNNSLTGGRGLDYLDEQWDYINDFDDNFLDAVESKLGIQQVQNLYEQAVADTAGDAKQQQRITDLMNQQIKILREKDKLTEYDVERAKAVLDIEKARMALEDARNNKTKMRLRRDSQGNYTYQYVADEEKLDDLQQALNDAQLNLYNQDKQHYKQNLDKLYDTYKDYIEKMRDLTAEYNATQDEEERARIQARIDLLKFASDEMMASLTEDNRQLLNYLDGSTLSALGIDGTQLTGEEIRQIVTTTVPQASSKIQDLTNSIAGQGGLLQATAATLQEIVNTTDEYDKAVADILEMGGTSLDVITAVVDSTGQAVDNNIINVEKLIAQNDELIKSCDDQISAIQKLMSWLDQYMNKVMDAERLIANLRAAYNTDQVLNDSNLRALNEILADNNLDTTAGMDVTSTVATNLSAAKKQIDALISIYERNLIETLSKSAAFDTGGYTGSWEDQSGKLAILHGKELVLNENDTTNILAAVQVIRDITSALSGFIDRDIGNTVNDIGSIINTPTTEHDILDQNVHIEANFPNVTQHTQIEQAFNNLVNIASQYAARPATV